MPPSRSATTSTLIWDGAPIARLRRGASALRPRVQVLDSEFLDGAQRERLRIRLQRFVDDRMGRDLAPLFAAAGTPAAAAGTPRPAAPADRGARPDRSATKATRCRRRRAPR